MAPPPPEGPRGPARLASLALPALLLVTALAYAPLHAAGLSWDDEALVVDNQVTGDPRRWRELLTADLWSTTRLVGLQSGYYRPLFLLSLALDRAVAGLSPAWAHLHSLLWHGLAVALLHTLVRRLLGPGPALLAAALAALHPVQSEALALVAARNDPMAAALLLGSLLVLVDPGERRPGRLLAGAGLALAAMLSKESAALAPLLLLLLDAGRGVRGAPGRAAALGAAVLCWLGLRALLGHNAGILPAPGSGGQLLAALPQVAGLYARLLLWPWPLSPARHLHHLPPLTAQLAPLLALAGLVALGLLRGARRGLVAAGLGLALLTWAPSLAATLDKGLLAERYLYLPLFGLGLALAAALPPRRAPWLLVLALPAVLLLHRRLPDWKDSGTVWAAAHRDTPSPFTAAGLGWYRHRDGDLDAAVPLLEEAVLGDPPWRDACGLVLLALLEAHREPEAVALGARLQAEGRCGAEGPFLQHLSLAQAGEGRWAEALATAARIPGGPAGPALVVVGADRARRGDLAGLAALARAQPDPPAFVQHVARLLRLGGEPAAADAALTLLRREP